MPAWRMHCYVASYQTYHDTIWATTRHHADSFHAESALKIRHAMGQAMREHFLIFSPSAFA